MEDMWAIVIFNQETHEIKVRGPFCCESCASRSLPFVIADFEDILNLLVTVTQIDTSEIEGADCVSDTED